MKVDVDIQPCMKYLSIYRHFTFMLHTDGVTKKYLRNSPLLLRRTRGAIDHRRVSSANSVFIETTRGRRHLKKEKRKKTT